MAETEIDGDRGEDDDHRGGDDRLGMAQHEPAGRLVNGEEPAADGVPLLRIVTAYGNRVPDPAEPEGPEVRPVHAREHHPQCRVQRHGQQRGHEHREVLGPREGPEKAPLLVDQREDRQERHRDHEQGEEDRRPHLEEGLQANLVEVALAAFALPALELFVGVLHLHDGPIH